MPGAIHVTMSTEPVAEAAPDPRALREAFARFPSGVAAICSLVGGTPVGMVVTSFTVGVSFEPPLVLFSVQNGSRTWPLLRGADYVGVSVLAADQAALASQLASRSSDRFEDVSLLACERDDALLIEGASLWLECLVRSETAAGDHTIVLLEVRALRMRDPEPMVYHGMQFRQLAD